MTAHRDWSRVRNAERKRKPVELTLSVEAHVRLNELAEAHPTRTKSHVVEDLILNTRPATADEPTR